MITIDELMTENPFSLHPSDSLESARQLMTEKHIRHIPITDEDNRLAGLVTQRDILEATGPEQKNPDLKISDFMTTNVNVITPAGSLRQAALHLQQKKYGCLPVVNDGHLVGIITDSDFIGVAINLLEQVEMTEDADDFNSDMDDLDVAPLESESY